MRPCLGWIGTLGVLSECNNGRGVDKIRVLNAEERGGVEREVFVLFEHWRSGLEGKKDAWQGRINTPGIQTDLSHFIMSQPRR